MSNLLQACRIAEQDCCKLKLLSDCSSVQRRCSRAQCNPALMCTGNKGTQTKMVARTFLLHAFCTTQFGGIWAFLQQQRVATPAVALLVSSGVWHIATGSDCLPLWFFFGIQTHVSTAVLIALVMVPQPTDDTTVHIQLSGNSRLSCTSLQHTDSPPTHLIMQMVSSTHALLFGYLGFRGTIAACEL
ncbi:hypothetical protein AVEN_208630-1 [Araneus ventricosus]|uniref:Uncharacterized protein n=1 Tax=Araneus ventricosus TaxID=182803 RepID=A0A4Y2GPH7_ARAVE|nr:hypothetical protein AVEN_208630-1 [Araneus ventricosus]